MTLFSVIIKSNIMDATSLPGNHSPKYPSKVCAVIHMWFIAQIVYYVAWITDGCGRTCQLLRGDVLYISSSPAEKWGLWWVDNFHWIYLYLTQLSKELVWDIWLCASNQFRTYGCMPPISFFRFSRVNETFNIDASCSAYLS